MAQSEATRQVAGPVRETILGRRGILVLICLTALLASGATVFLQRVLEDEAPVEGAQRVTVRSAVLGEEREYYVHLPEGYANETERRFPVLYALDGVSQSGHVAESAALLARIGVIPPLIVVGVPSVDGETRNRDLTPKDMRLDSDDPKSARGASHHFAAFLREELIPRVERDYRVERPRILAGWSRGGLFTVDTLVETPTLFDAWFAHSPALWRENGLIVTRLERALADGRVGSGVLYLSLGELENEKMGASFRQASDILRTQSPGGFRWRADVTRGGTHESNPRLAAPLALCFLFRGADPCGRREAAHPQPR